jgi:transcriptional regulator with XRE-family HTH domain
MNDNIYTKYRVQLGLTKSEFADLLGLSPTSIYMYENGLRVPSFRTIRHILDVLSRKGLKVSHLEFRTE